LDKFESGCKLGDASQLVDRGELERGLSSVCVLWLGSSFVDLTSLVLLAVWLAALSAAVTARTLLVSRRVAVGSEDWSCGCWHRTKMSSFAEPSLCSYIEFPRILISFLSIPLLIRDLLSLRNIDSIFLSVVDVNGLMKMLGWSSLAKCYWK
jgi:hypothetical protein